MENKEVIGILALILICLLIVCVYVGNNGNADVENRLDNLESVIVDHELTLIEVERRLDKNDDMWDIQVELNENFVKLWELQQKINLIWV